MADYQKLYQTLSQMADLPESERAKIPRLFRPMTLLKDEHFVVAGTKSETIGFITGGLLRHYYLDEDGNDYTKSFLVAGDFCGAFSAALTNTPSRMYIQALEDSAMLVTTFEVYFDLLESHPTWQIIGRKNAEALFIKKELRESELLLDDAETRYLKFQQRYPDLEKRVKQYHIASYLGITPVSLSRIRHKLATEV